MTTQPTRCCICRAPLAPERAEIWGYFLDHLVAHHAEFVHGFEKTVHIEPCFDSTSSSTTDYRFSIEPGTSCSTASYTYHTARVLGYKCGCGFGGTRAEMRRHLMNEEDIEAHFAGIKLALCAPEEHTP